MLKVLHNHIFASKLREVFASSPLVLVYQTLGDVSIPAITDQLQRALEQQLPGAGVTASVCRMRNAVAASTGDVALQRFFQASNMLVGFSTPEYVAHSQGGSSTPGVQQQHQQEQQVVVAQQASSRGLEHRASRHSALQDVLGGLLGEATNQAAACKDSSSSSGSGGNGSRAPHPAQATMKALVGVASRLPSQQPLLLLGAFYQRRNLRLADLKRWAELNQAQVC